MYAITLVWVEPDSGECQDGKYAEAQYNVGFRYSTGAGVPEDDAEEDDAEAVRWYGLAADQGIAEAQYNVGVSYADGLGVPRSSYRIIAATSSSVRNSRSPYSVGRSTGVIVATS